MSESVDLTPQPGPVSLPTTVKRAFARRHRVKSLLLFSGAPFVVIGSAVGYALSLIPSGPGTAVAIMAGLGTGCAVAGYVGILGTPGPGVVDRIAQGFSITDRGVASLFGVGDDTVKSWRHDMFDAKDEAALAATAAVADLYARSFQPAYRHAHLLRPSTDLGNRTPWDVIREGGQGRVYAAVDITNSGRPPQNGAGVA